MNVYQPQNIDGKTMTSRIRKIDPDLAVITFRNQVAWPRTLIAGVAVCLTWLSTQVGVQAQTADPAPQANAVQIAGDAEATSSTSQVADSNGSHVETTEHEGRAPNEDSRIDRQSSELGPLSRLFPNMRERMQSGSGLDGRGPRGPSDPSSLQASPRMSGPGGQRGRWGGIELPQVSREPADDDEWNQVREFMKTHSPNRLEIYDRITADRGDDRPASIMIRQRIVMRHRGLEALRQSQPDLYPFMLQQVQIEDQIIGQFRKARSPDADPAQVEQSLAELVKKFVDNSLNERQARLARLKKMLEEEEQRIEKDRASIGQLMDRQRRRFDDEFTRMLDRVGASITKPPE